METIERRRIPYVEYRAIGSLLDAHTEVYGNKLRAVVAFGDLVTRGTTFDIDLLEVVEDWQGGRFGEFASSEELPLRGRLRLYFLTPGEFEDPAVITEPAERAWVEDLLRTVRQANHVVLQSPPGYAEQVLERVPLPPSGSVDSSDPFNPSAGRGVITGGGALTGRGTAPDPFEPSTREE